MSEFHITPEQYYDGYPRQHKNVMKKDEPKEISIAEFCKKNEITLKQMFADLHYLILDELKVRGRIPSSKLFAYSDILKVMCDCIDEDEYFVKDANYSGK